MHSATGRGPLCSEHLGSIHSQPETGLRSAHLLWVVRCQPERPIPACLGSGERGPGCGPRVLRPDGKRWEPRRLPRGGGFEMGPEGAREVP